MENHRKLFFPFLVVDFTIFHAYYSGTEKRQCLISPWCTYTAMTQLCNMLRARFYIPFGACTQIALLTPLPLCTKVLVVQCKELWNCIRGFLHFQWNWYRYRNHEQLCLQWCFWISSVCMDIADEQFLLITESLAEWSFDCSPFCISLKWILLV